MSRWNRLSGSVRIRPRRALSTAMTASLGVAVLVGSAAQASTKGYTVSPDGSRIEIWGTGRTADNTGPKGLMGA